MRISWLLAVGSSNSTLERRSWQGKSLGSSTRNTPNSISRPVRPHPLSFQICSPMLQPLSLVCPPFVYGPPILPFSKPSLGSPGALYKLIDGQPGRPLPTQLLPFHLDVRDLARGYVRADLELKWVCRGCR